MNELQIFNSEEFGQVRTVLIDNEPYFVGKDVAAALGYINPQDALKNHIDIMIIGTSFVAFFLYKFLRKDGV